MPRTIVTLFALATLSAAAPLLAQSAYSAGPGTSSSYPDSNSTQSYNGAPAGSDAYTQSAAPIQRNYNNGAAGYGQPAQGSQGSQQSQPMNATSEPAHGVWLVTAPDALVQTVSASANHTELRVEHGRANVNVYHPAEHSDILVDLPGGPVSLVKDGLYTFNADTNTVRVLHGEAEIASNGAKTVKVKEDHQFTFGVESKAQDAGPYELRADLLQGNYGGGDGYRHGDGYGYGAGFYGGPYAYGWPYYGFYGPGFGYPYYAFGGPFGYGYPYGYGFGLGFGYYGGFRGGYGGFRR